MHDESMNEQLIIEGFSQDNKKFRPSDWVERISAILASFGSDHKLRYSEFVQPCVIQGEKCLIIARGLNKNNPEVFEFILQFAKQNNLRIQEDRRVKEKPVEIERRKQQEWKQEAVDENASHQKPAA